MVEASWTKEAALCYTNHQREERREREATILHNQNASGAYCFPDSFHCVAIDLLYVFLVLFSVFSITSCCLTSTKDKASVFNHESLYQTKKQQHTPTRKNEEQTQEGGNTLHWIFREQEFDVNVWRRLSRSSHLFFFLFPFPPSFHPLCGKNDLAAVVVRLQNTAWVWISLLFSSFTCSTPRLGRHTSTSLLARES